MDVLFKNTTYILGAVLVFLMSFIIFDIYDKNKKETIQSYEAVVSVFNLNQGEINYIKDGGLEDDKEDTVFNSDDIGTTADNVIIQRAKAMTDVKWIPSVNIKGFAGKFTFLKGKTYTGVPYSMGAYQVTTPTDFLSKIKYSSKLIGNDCSGFVSAAWGISRQTTLSFYTAAKNGRQIDGHYISIINWDDLTSGDAILKEDGRGKGHIVIFKAYNDENKNTIIVYEQNVSTVVPYEPIPAAREDKRSKATMIEEGYFPIRLL